MAKKQDINLNLVLTLSGIAVVYFGVINPLLKKIGIKKTPEGKLIDSQNQLPNSDNPFSPVFLRNQKAGVKITLLKSDVKKNLAKRIYEALGYFSDDEAAIISVFRTLKTKSQVADLATAFNTIYKIDLLDFLSRGKGIMPQSGLNESELSEILKIVNNLPKLTVK